MQDRISVRAGDYLGDTNRAEYGFHSLVIIDSRKEKGHTHTKINGHEIESSAIYSSRGLSACHVIGLDAAVKKKRIQEPEGKWKVAGSPP